MNLTTIQQLEVAIRDCPADPEPYLQLAALYLEKHREYEAERMLAKGEAATGDARVRKLREDVTMLRLEQNVALAKEQLAAGETPEARSMLEQVRSDRDRTELEIFRARAKRDPNDAHTRYELGRRWQRSGKLAEACQQFEAALADPIFRPQAAFELAECLRELQQIAPAMKHYRLAAESARGDEHLPVQKRALWQAARLAVQIKLNKLSQYYLSDLARIDPQYSAAAPLPAEPPTV